jgi:hypothetical protein
MKWWCRADGTINNLVLLSVPGFIFAGPSWPRRHGDAVDQLISAFSAACPAAWR